MTFAAYGDGQFTAQAEQVASRMPIGSPFKQAIQTAVGLYKNNPAETRSYDERVNEILDTLVVQFNGYGEAMQRQMLEALGAQDLVTSGAITMPVFGPCEGVLGLAADKYVDAIRTDPYQIERLVQVSAAAGVTVAEGERPDQYSRRLAVADFGKGRDGCEFPDLYDEAIAQADSDFRNSDDIVDIQAQEQRQRSHLFRLAAGYREREQATNIARAVASDITIGLRPTAPPDDDSVSPDVLMLSLGDDTDDLVQRPRGG